MVYLPDLMDQTRLFLYSLGFGFALGVLYDLFRLFRLLAVPKAGRGYFIAQDVIYSILCAVLSFFFFLAAGDGALRGFCIIGEILGWLVYYFSLGAVFMRVSEWIARQMRRFFAWVIHVITSPFLRFLKLLEKISVSLHKVRKYFRFTKKNLRFNLHFTPQMVYNEARNRQIKKKEHRSLAKQTPRADSASKKRRSSAQKTAIKEESIRQPFAVGGGSGVRAFRGVQYSKRPRGNRRHRG